MKISGNKLGGKRYHKPAIAAVALGALMSFQAGAARADDTAAEIRLLQERLRQLEQRVAEQARKEKGLRRRSARGGAAWPAARAICLSNGSRRRSRPSAAAPISIWY